VTVIRQMAPRSTTCRAKHYTDGRLATQPPSFPAACGGKMKAR